MPTLYVTEPGARLEKEYHRLLVTKEDEILLRVQLNQVSQVVLVGAVGVTTPALHALLEQRIPLFLVRRSGELLGRLQSTGAGWAELRIKQYIKSQDTSCRMKLSKEIVSAKLRHQRTLALRIIRRHPASDDNEILSLKQAETQVENAADLDTLRGIEGSGAKAYFSIYRRAFDPIWKFQNRNRRPPRDPINALLSLGYTLLTNTIITALEIVGLDPYSGIFHSSAKKQPALALDLLEEFRAPFVDSLVMAIINRRLLKPSDFLVISEENGILATCLSDKGLRIYLREFGDKLESEVKPVGLSRPLSYRLMYHSFCKF